MFCGIRSPHSTWRWLAKAAAVLVADGVEGDHLRVVVLVALLFLKRTVDIRHRTVIISIVTGSERMPPTALRGVLLRRATCGRQHDGDNHKGDYMSFKSYAHLVWAEATISLLYNLQTVVLLPNTIILLPDKASTALQP